MQADRRVSRRVKECCGMMADANLNSNPFSALFGSVEQAQQFSVAFKEDNRNRRNVLDLPTLDALQATTSDSRPTIAGKSVSKINSLIEHVYLVTLDQEPFPDRPPRCVYLEDFKESLNGQEWIDLDIIEQAVFERIMLPSAHDNVIVTGHRSVEPEAADTAAEANPLHYLYHCYKRLQAYPKQVDLEPAVNKCTSVILMNAKTCFQQPAFFNSLNPVTSFLDIFLHQSESDFLFMEFFEKVIIEIDANKFDGSVGDVFSPVLDNVRDKFQKEFSLGHGVLYDYLELLLLFSRINSSAEALVRHSTPSDRGTGRSFENTLFGSILSISSIVKNEQGPFDFFDRPSRYTKKEHDITEQSIHKPISILNEKMHQLFKNILKAGPQAKSLLLEWLGNCMLANKGRAKMWSRQMPGMFNQMYASDGFYLNLCAVLLHLCKPFSEPCSSKLLKVQPTYCLATIGEREQVKNRNVHLRDVNETGLIPADEGAENEQPQPESNYNFLTECFFMAHYSLHLGFHVIHEHFMKLNQDLHRIQGVYQDIVGQGGENTDPGVRIKDAMEKGMAIFLCLKAALTESRLLEMCLDFHVATTTYLIQMAAHSDHSSFHDVTLPLSDNVPQVLTAIPEFVAENVIDFMLFIRRFKDSLYETVGVEKLNHLMTFILVFMGSPHHMRNPHLRARMAEALESIMPPKPDQSGSFVSSYQRGQLFDGHPLSEHLAPTLLHVFVSIEMTGQGVEFEQKFNYRRPMYTILEYLWTVDRHKAMIKKMARHAEEHLADMDAPLFLRFINLLINDATFLLDEALDYMSQIKQKQEEKERGDWDNLDPHQKQEAENNFRQLTMLARFHNIMGNDTIKTLEMITTDIKSIFYDDILVNRIAAMLNNHLLCLVGPRQKNLKVKGFAQFEFKPDRTVSHISQIYLNLAESDVFKLAVAHEERSYSNQLFVQAVGCMTKIRRPMEVIQQFENLSAELSELAKQKEEEDDLVNAAPEEFIDPILGTFMRHPVKLPSSGNIVDKSTIARHILSDQFDPFNRQPLTMDMVEPMLDLESRIVTWVKEWRQKRHQDKVTS